MLIFCDLRIEDDKFIDTSEDAMYEDLFWNIDPTISVHFLGDWDSILDADTVKIDEYLSDWLGEDRSVQELVVAHGNGSIIVSRLNMLGYSFDRLLVIDKFSIEHAVGRYNMSDEDFEKCRQYYHRLFKNDLFVDPNCHIPQEKHVEFYAPADKFDEESKRQITATEVYKVLSDVDMITLQSYEPGLQRMCDFTKLGTDGYGADKIMTMVLKLLR